MACALVLLLLALCVPVLQSIMNDLPPPSKEGEKFYIYSGEEWDRVATASHRKRDPNEILNGSYNSGAGEVLDASRGMYHTDQYHMYSLVYFRLLTDPRRTLDPWEATSFFVPYDFSLDSAYYKHCVKSVGSCYDFRKCPLAPQVERLLRASPHWQKKQGSDHFAIVGMNYAMEHYLNKPRCKSYLTGACHNCTKFAIDDYHFLLAGSDGSPLKGVNWAAAPFPSDFHWNKNFHGEFPWDNTDRPLLVSFIGTANSFWSPAKRLRGSIVHYCSIHTDCTHIGYGANGTRSSMLVEGYTPLDVAKQSIFCLQPYGDLMTRKGLFDSLLMGCIPVTFSSLTAAGMYIWHWSEALWAEVAVQLPSKGVAFRYEDPITVLKNMLKNEPEVIKRKQELLRKHAFELHWAIDPPIRKGPVTGATSAAMTAAKSPWPMDPNKNGTSFQADAFETLMRWVLGWHSGRLSRDFGRRGHLPPAAAPGMNPCWTGKPNADNTRCVHPEP